MANWQKKAAMRAAAVPRLEYKPSPGLYSRLERAANELPATVKVPSLLNNLRKYPEGVPGWEVDAVGLADAFKGSQTVPRQDVVDLVRAESPVFTMRQARLHRPPARPNDVPAPWAGVGDEGALGLVQVFDTDPPAATPYHSPLGSDVVQDTPKYENFGANRKADDYTELLLLDKTQEGHFRPHWDNYPGAAAHMRFGTNGDALRIYEMQSDVVNQALKRGGQAAVKSLPYALKDSYGSILSKLALIEAAKRGHRAVEVVNPELLAYMHGGRAEHRYGRVVPGELERAAKSVGGLVPERVAVPERLSNSRDRMDFEADQHEAFAELERQLGDEQDLLDSAMVGLLEAIRDPVSENPREVRHAIRDLRVLTDSSTRPRDVIYRQIADNLIYHHIASVARGPTGPLVRAFQDQHTIPLLWQLATESHNSRVAMQNALRQRDLNTGTNRQRFIDSPGRRWIMPDETRRRIITQGIPAAVMAPVAAEALSEEKRRDPFLGNLRSK